MAIVKKSSKPTSAKTSTSKTSSKTRTSKTTAKKPVSKTATKTATKTTASKTSSKKPTTAKKTTTTRKPRAAKVVEPVTPIKEKMTAMQFIDHLVQETSLDKKTVKNILTVIGDTIKGHLAPKGSGELNFLGLMKIKVRDVPAKPKRKGRNPFTGEDMMFKAKPASRKPRILPMSKLKQVVSPS